ncbi:DPH3 homolog [Orcinus orca]|uniref:DPH3 homolog n=1 Tax=Orcinus orca TaxID=9733 RepID=UPI001440FDAF|nr:DPH3 homolog [Orcinus orca]
MAEATRPLLAPVTMAAFHEVEIKDFQYDEVSEMYFYPCPCGDNFCVTKEHTENGEDVATRPGCSLIIKAIYDKGRFTCGGTVPAPPPSEELVKCRRLRTPEPQLWGRSQAGKIERHVTGFFTGTILVQFAVC